MKLDLNIFKTNRIGLSQMYDDAMNYVKNTYAANDQEFTMASPFAQIINVIVNLGRMILFYIESSVTELNIETAYQSRSVIGLSELTGHVPSRGIAARGTIYMTYNRNSDYAGETISIKNFTGIRNSANGLVYRIILPANILQITVGDKDSKMEFPIVQGDVKYQQGTGTGEAMQSFNFASKTDDIVDEFFANVYVNGKRWEKVDSILDMTYEQEACIVKTSVNGGIDVFFGTGNNGKIPVVGSTILFEYIVSSGAAGNLEQPSSEIVWTFEDQGYDQNGDYVDLNAVYSLYPASDILFGTYGESIEMTRKLAPHMSRSFVLANDVNYKTFLSKLNMFSIIDVFSGFNTVEDIKIEGLYNDAKNEYNALKYKYSAQINLTGVNSQQAIDLLELLTAKKNEVDALKVEYDRTKMDDNVVYLYLVPDITKRITSSDNYFTCSIDRFGLTSDEKKGILDLIENSGRKAISIENRIIDPIFAKFSVNITVRIYNNYNFNAVKQSIISAVSDYAVNMTRRVRIPVSDIIRIVEEVDGVDSVNVYFDADKNNQLLFGDGNYGIDEYGDILLSRNLSDRLGNNIEVNDVQPLFRGGFTSNNGIYYEDSLTGLLGPINITLAGKVDKNRGI